MIDPNVLTYIRTEAGKGVSRDAIAQALMQSGGWTLDDVHAHLKILDENPNKPVASMAAEKKKRTVFQNILWAFGRILLVALVIAVIGFGVCLLILSGANF